MKEFSALLDQFSPIGLPDMKAVSLMDRVDTKFIFHKKHLPNLLNDLKNQYRILDIDSERTATYKNLYFDTERFKFYNDHHNGKGERSKIRIRNYVETNVYYLEIKHKNNKGRTNKKRIQIPELQRNFSDRTSQFVNQNGADAANLSPVLTNSFKRITLVSLENQERITFDLALSYEDKKSTVTYKSLVIAEVKQAVFDRSTPLFQLLKRMRINPYRISKYCIGMATTRKTLKQNAFKEKIRLLNKIAS